MAQESQKVGREAVNGKSGTRVFRKIEEHSDERYDR